MSELDCQLAFFCGATHSALILLHADFASVRTAPVGSLLRHDFGLSRRPPTGKPIVATKLLPSRYFDRPTTKGKRFTTLDAGKATRTIERAHEQTVAPLRSTSTVERKPDAAGGTDLGLLGARPVGKAATTTATSTPRQVELSAANGSALLYASPMVRSSGGPPGGLAGKPATTSMATNANQSFGRGRAANIEQHLALGLGTVQAGQMSYQLPTAPTHASALPLPLAQQLAVTDQRLYGHSSVTAQQSQSQSGYGGGSAGMPLVTKMATTDLRRDPMQLRFNSGRTY